MGGEAFSFSFCEILLKKSSENASVIYNVKDIGPSKL